VLFLTRVGGVALEGKHATTRLQLLWRRYVRTAERVEVRADKAERLLTVEERVFYLATYPRLRRRQSERRWRSLGVGVSARRESAAARTCRRRAPVDDIQPSCCKGATAAATDLGRLRDGRNGPPTATARCSRCGR